MVSSPCFSLVKNIDLNFFFFFVFFFGDEKSEIRLEARYIRKREREKK